MSVLYDAHCHFDFPVFDGRRDEILSACRQAGVERLVIAGVRRPDWARVVATAATAQQLYYCLGIHPWWAGEHEERDLVALEHRLRERDSKCVALGECGLDALRGDPSGQASIFIEQVRMASRLKMPLVVHSVKTHDKVASILKREQFSQPVLVHGFSGSWQQATHLIDLGACLGIGGVITHARARKTRDVVAQLPLESLVLETDAPDMAPAGVGQGKNSPENVRQVFDSLSELRPETPEVLMQALWDNAARVFGW